MKRSREARLDRAEVSGLYIEHRLSASEIGARMGVSASTIRRHLRKWGVPLRNVLEAQQPRGRRPCPRSTLFRAYLMGFALGDLCVVQPHEAGQTILAYCSTTRQEQVDLVRELFGSFGPVRWSGQTIRASLDLSFSFLLSKYERRMPT